MTRAPAAGSPASWRWTVVALVASTAVVAAFVRVGADWEWMVAVGDHVRATGRVPDRVPFAAADSAGWRDVPVLAQLLVSWLADAGGAAPVVAHLVLVALALTVLALAARRRGAGDGQVAVTLALVTLGSLPALGVVRAQTWSLLPFALLLALLASQARTPDRRIWWAVPLVAVWGNLHGAVLLGVCVLGAYLLVGRLRRRPVETVAVGVAALLALGANPQLWRTPRYYVDVFDNVSAERAEGLWARPSLAMPFDVAMLLAAAVLVVVLLRRRREAWEYVAVAGMCVVTASAARHGVWLLFVLAVLAAGRRATPAAGEGEGTTGDGSARRPPALSAPSAVLAVPLALLVAVPLVLSRGEVVEAAPRRVVERVAEVAGPRVVLAPAPLSEALAVAGVTVWVSNPIDAFSRTDQAAYLDFLDGRAAGGSAVAAADVVVVAEGSDPERLVADLPGWDVIACGAGWRCYVRG